MSECREHRPDPVPLEVPAVRNRACPKSWLKSALGNSALQQVRSTLRLVDGLGREIGKVRCAGRPGADLAVARIDPTTDAVTVREFTRRGANETQTGFELREIGAHSQTHPAGARPVVAPPASRRVAEEASLDDPAGRIVRHGGSKIARRRALVRTD